MSCDADMSLSREEDRDISALVAASNRLLLDVPPESIAYALSALGERIGNPTEDSSHVADDGQTHAVILNAVETRLETLLVSITRPTLSDASDENVNDDEREGIDPVTAANANARIAILDEATRAADVAARLATDTDTRFRLRFRGFFARVLRAASALAAHSASAVVEVDGDVNGHSENDQRRVEAWSAATEAACRAAAAFSASRDATKKNLPGASDRMDHETDTDTDFFLAAFGDVVTSALGGKDDARVGVSLDAALTKTKESTASALRRGGAARVLACASPDLLDAFSFFWLTRNAANAVIETDREGGLASRVASALRREREPWIREALVAALGSVSARALSVTFAPRDAKLNDTDEKKNKSGEDKPQNDAELLVSKTEILQGAIATVTQPPQPDASIVSTPTEETKTKEATFPPKHGKIVDPFDAADVAVFKNVELDAAASLLSDACGFVRLAATRALGRGGERARGALTKLLPNLRAADAELREATLRTLEAAWREDAAAAVKTENTEETAGKIFPSDEVVGELEGGSSLELSRRDVSLEAKASVANDPISSSVPRGAPAASAEPKEKEKEKEKRRSDPPEIRRAMALTAAAAADMLRDPDGGVREAACELFGCLREHALHAGVVETMQALCEKDAEESVRDAAIVSLTKLGYYNPLTGRQRKTRARAGLGPRFGPDGRLITRKPLSSLSRRTACEVGSTIRVWWPDDACFYEARVRAWDREKDVHTLVYILDGVEEDLDLKKERCELRYKPHKRGAKEAWLPINKPAKKAKVAKPPKPPKPTKPPRRAVVTTAAVSKGEIVSVGVAVRVFWPLDDAWYGGHVTGYETESKKHVVLYHDGVEERLDFEKEKVVTVTESLAGTSGVLFATCDSPPVRLPVVCGARGVGWLMPNPRRGRELVQFLDATTNATTTVTAAEFAARFDDDDEKSGKSTQSKRWRRGCRFDPTRAGSFWKARGGERAISLGGFLQQQGAAWGEAIVGKPVTLRPEGFEYDEETLLSAERAADATARNVMTEKAVTTSVPAAALGELAPDAPAASADAVAEGANRESLTVQEGAERRSPGPGGGSASPSAAETDASAEGDSADTTPAEWVTVSVLAYSDASGEHQVLFPDGKREWLALVMQETGGSA